MYHTRSSIQEVCPFCTFSFVPSFVAKTQNPALLDAYFDEFIIPFLRDFVDGVLEELLLCLVRTIEVIFQGQTNTILPATTFFIITKRKKKHVTRNTISCGYDLSLLRHINGLTQWLYYNEGQSTLSEEHGNFSYLKITSLCKRL